MMLRILLPQLAAQGNGFEANWADVIISNPDTEVPKAMSVAEKAGALLLELLDDNGDVLQSLASDTVLYPTVQA